MTTYAIQVKNLKKKYQDCEALKGISFQVEKGEIFAFLGENGAGKSTVISILSTLLEYDYGVVEVVGKQVRDKEKEIRQALGVVFQNSMLDASLSVKENLRIRCGLYGLYHNHAKERVKELTAQCQLSSFLSQPVHTLSGGQRRRVDIARALIPNPEVLILDEPSTGLDPLSRKHLWDMIQSLHKQYHMTIFLTTHYIEEAEIANHICMIRKGEIVLDTCYDDLKQVYGFDEVLLYTKAMRNVKQVVEQMHVSYTMNEDCFIIKTMNFYQTMSLLRKCEIYISKLEVKTKKLEDIYVEIMKEETI